jgi:membrane protease YdiL (CAAX protease family)
MRFSVGIVQALPMTDPALAATADRAAPLRDGRLRGIDALWIALVFFLGQGAVIAASLVIGVIYGLITHRPLLGGEGLTADVTQAVIVVAMATAAAVFFFGSLWIARRRGIGMVELGFRRTEGRWYLLAAVLFVLFFLIDGFLFRWVDPSGALQEQLTSQLFLRTDSVLWMAVVALAAGPITAVAEETLFRGLVYRWLRERATVIVAVLVSGALFGISHFYFLVPGGTAGIVLTAEIMVMGFLTAWLVQASGSLWPPILLHLLNNSAVVLFAFIDAAG